MYEERIEYCLEMDGGGSDQGGCTLIIKTDPSQAQERLAVCNKGKKHCLER